MSDPRMMQKNPDGTWSEAEPIPFYYGLLPRIIRFFTGGRWPR